MKILFKPKVKCVNIIIDEVYIPEKIHNFGKLGQSVGWCGSDWGHEGLEDEWEDWTVSKWPDEIRGNLLQSSKQYWLLGHVIAVHWFNHFANATSLAIEYKYPPLPLAFIYRNRVTWKKFNFPILLITGIGSHKRLYKLFLK